MGNLSLDHGLHTSLISCYMLSKAAKEYAKHSEQTEFTVHIVSILSPALFTEIQFRRNNLISREIFSAQYTFLFEHKQWFLQWKQNKTKQKFQAKFHVYNYPLVSKTNKQKAVWMQSSSAVFPTIFADFFFSFQQWSLCPDRKACTLNDLLGLSISLCLVLYVDQLSVFVLIIIYYKKKFL